MKIPTFAERARSLKGNFHPHDVYQAEIAELRAALDAQSGKTCQHCKHWHKSSGYPRHHCANIVVIDMLDADSWVAFESPADFGCTLWEPKP